MAIRRAGFIARPALHTHTHTCSYCRRASRLLAEIIDGRNTRPDDDDSRRNDAKQDGRRQQTSLPAAEPCYSVVRTCVGPEVCTLLSALCMQFVLLYPRRTGGGIKR